MFFVKYNGMFIVINIAVVPKGVKHAIGGKVDFKILQMILMK